MNKSITINPVTRIEGHARIIMNLDDSGKVAETLFCVQSFRGFERFVQGAPAERLPLITARICGICYSAHNLASVRAIENAWNISVSETTSKLRTLLLLGQYLESHALSLSVLSLPDLLYPRESAINRNVQFLLTKHEQLVKGALDLRMMGSQFTEIVGRRHVHPIASIIGGMSISLKEEERRDLLVGMDKCKPALDALCAIYMEIAQKNEDDTLQLGNITSKYMSMVDGNRLSFDRGNLRLINKNGSQIIEIEPGDYFKFIHEEERPYSFMKFPFTSDGNAFRVGPLARINIAGEIPTPQAAELKARFAAILPPPWHGSIFYHFARLIETVYAWEAAYELLLDPSITSEDVKPDTINMKTAEGTGVIEAPRGILVHNYKLNAEGFCEKARFVVATQHNNLCINESLLESAQKLVNGQDIPETELNKLEMIVRAYDPCLSCATHALGGRTMSIEMRDCSGKMVRRW